MWKKNMVKIISSIVFVTILFFQCSSNHFVQAEEILKGGRSFHEALTLAEEKLDELNIQKKSKNLYFNSKHRVEVSLQKRFRHHSDKCATEASKSRIDKAIGLVTKIKKEDVKGALKDLDVHLRLDWEPKSSRGGKGLGCHINLQAGDQKYGIQYFAPALSQDNDKTFKPSDNKFCDDELFVTFQVFYLEKVIGGNTNRHFEDLMNKIKNTDDVREYSERKKCNNTYNSK